MATCLFGGYYFILVIQTTSTDDYVCIGWLLYYISYTGKVYQWIRVYLVVIVYISYTDKVYQWIRVYLVVIVLY